MDCHPQTIRVALLLATRFYREGLAHCLRREDRLEVVAAFGVRSDAICTVSEANPDVIVLDTTRDEALSTIRDLHRLAPDAKVVALGVHEAGEEVTWWAEAGAAGYVSRDGSLDDLVGTVIAAAHGELHCPPMIAGALARRLASLSEALGVADNPLTSRETQVADLLERGLSNKEIAARMNIEVATVKNHVHRVLEKLGASRRAEVPARMHALR